MTDVTLTSSCILIVDDQPANVELLELILQTEGFGNIITTTDARHVLRLCKQHNPDLVLLDLHMPHLDGLRVLDQLTALNAGIYLPVLILTADLTVKAKRTALARGAKDFLAKPLDAAEVLLRVRNLLETRVLYKKVKLDNQLLEQRVEERTQQLQAAQIEILDRLALASEYRDDDTGQHAQRVGLLAAMVAGALGQSKEQIQVLRLAAPLHDVGKIGVPDSIFLKAGQLSPAEFDIMRSHTKIGGDILAKSNFAVLRLAREIALSHHERWDGTGYPLGIKGEGIPLSARIVAVVDVFDALVNERPYKKAWSVDDAIAEIHSQAGRHFDPRVVQAFLRVITSDDIQNLVRNLHALQPGATHQVNSPDPVMQDLQLHSNRRTQDVSVPDSAVPA